MYLLVCATAIEMEPLTAALQGEEEATCLVGGVGPVETAISLTRFLENRGASLSGVINFGVAGAYCGAGLDLLDICLASQESFGDMGIAVGEDIIPFSTDRLAITTSFQMDSELLERAGAILTHHEYPFVCGNFITVNAVSGTGKRGDFLQKRYDAICENMEGAAVARVCREFDLPCLEVRCISNLVEDRDPSRWKLSEAAEKAAEAVSILAEVLV